MKKFLKRVLAVAALGVLVSVSASFAEEGFPLRAKFPKVKYVTTEALNRDYAQAVIVDVRSDLEYSVIHINKALHIPIAQATFVKDLEKARSKENGKPAVFYCNGHSCAKAYEAAEQAMQAGFKNVFAYDAGIHDWVKMHPEKTTLMGVTPAPKNKLISGEALAKKKISLGEFKKKAEGPKAVVVDIREPFQRKVIPPFPKLRNIPSDRLLSLLEKGEFKNNDLLIFDAVGKQVEWLQYYLEKNGYSNYSFLKDGVLSVK
ncbi:rhodanese-like domain-containing protein [Geotalea sp. SG265]|uniref:rhodanese-like domain-containing protein n=1 Tax=Geotalea sp. SG265 TaxID=2922867 RepID=UPI001FAFC638|nr:rhodanese-like domain-containing protein [Geotalea sp. SG265]